MPESSRPDAAAPVRRRVVIDGDVQGVGYRYNCARRAEDAGLEGWVRNRDDGRVEAVFEGPPAAVDAVVGWCRGGPRGAEVNHVTVDDEEPTGAGGGFRIID